MSPGYTPIQTGFTSMTQLQSLLFTPGSSAFHTTYSELTGQPTPSQTTTLIMTLEVSAPETAVAPVIGTGTTEMIPSTETETRVATTQLHTSSEAADMTQTASPLAS
jgi:hypothetical protein